MHLWTLAEFVEQPIEKLQNILDEITGPGPRRLTDLPQMRDISGLPDFLLQLRNGGIKPQVVGDFGSLPTRINRAAQERSQNVR